MRVSPTPCFILHQRLYKETSLLLDVFSREHGRISLIAKGVRNNRKKSMALYQPYRSLNVSWSGKGDLQTLTGIESNGLSIVLNPDAVMAAFYLNELIIRLLHKHEPSPSLFDAYYKALTRLSHGEITAISLRYFEKHLLKILGYGLVLDRDVNTDEPLLADEHYHYTLDRGPSLIKPDNISTIRITGAALLALDNENLNEESNLEEIKHLMRSTLATYLGDKPLASRELYQSYLANKSAVE